VFELLFLAVFFAVELLLDCLFAMRKRHKKVSAYRLPSLKFMQ